MTWNISVTDLDDDPGVFDAATELANLDLFLYDSSGSFLGSLLDQSVATVYNHEHIYLAQLGAGDYTFRIDGDLATDFGFAWRMTVIPEPALGAVIGWLAAAWTMRRRRNGGNIAVER